ncbi:protein-glutamate O-methyltransferase CheR [Methylosinus sp. Sm6]|uniref:CheR family methyltransferase n=1 Tax=Methylosinus sp. Sm6 TaxID=2866948 RepID=UPI001C993561|nr:CheR family methyltransferase [Methylosinus sp. Sm6]MBY6242653.1 methyltransferase domain-containing protein [Methylosinus sp. Sm6]
MSEISVAGATAPTIRLDGLSDRYFRTLAAFVERETGIRLPPSKRMMVEGRLRRRVKALGLADLDEYAELVFERGQLEKESVHLIDCMTTNKTDFFREPEHFQILAQDIMPQLLAQRRRRTDRFKLWSAASSIGAEAYTIAMVLADLAKVEPFDFRILGTDICSAALAQARRAVYPEDMLAPTPLAMRERYVMRSRDPARREARIVPELRRLTRFERLNLMDASYPVDEGMDVIFCRNVLIYFSARTQQAVVANLCRHLRPGGYLLLGHSESMAGGKQPDMRQIASTVFRREGGRA